MSPRRGALAAALLLLCGCTSFTDTLAAQDAAATAAPATPSEGAPGADDAGAQVTVRGKVGALGEDGRARVDLTVTSDGEKVLSLARATVQLA